MLNVSPPVPGSAPWKENLMAFGMGHEPQLGEYLPSHGQPECGVKHDEWDLVCNQPAMPGEHDPEVHVATSAGIVFATWPVIA